MLNLGNKVFTVYQKKEVKEVEFLKYTKRGTSAFFKDGSEERLIALWNIYETENEARKELQKIENHRLYKKQKKEEERIRYENEREEIFKIMTKIEKEFNIEKIPFLSQPYTIEDANKMYRKMKKENLSHI